MGFHPKDTEDCDPSWRGSECPPGVLQIGLDSHHTYVITFLSLPLPFKRNGGSDFGPTCMELLIIILPPGNRSLFRLFLGAKPRLVCQGEATTQAGTKIAYISISSHRFVPNSNNITTSIKLNVCYFAPKGLFTDYSQTVGQDSLFCRWILFCCA